MRRKYAGLAFALSLLIVGALVSLQGSAAPAPAQDPLVGTWNLTGTNPNYPFIAVMSFNLGGTTVEYDSQGTNSSTAESIDLGKWRKTGNLAYTFKQQNYVYDTSGNLSLIGIASCDLTLASTRASFSDTCAVNFYNCSLSSCPGSLVSGPTTVTATGTRF
jgi:hypothetical protein